MKRILLYITIALATIGCAKDDTSGTSPVDGVINFTAGVVSTRVAGDDDCAWADGDKVGIFSDQSGESNFEYTISNSATGAMATSDVFYPLTSGARNYYAYHPFSEAQDESSTIAIDCTTEQSKPLLWATALSNDVEVALRFSHQFAKVSFTLTAGGLDATLLDGLTAWLVGANAKAEFDILSSEFSNLSADRIDLKIENNLITAYLPPVSGVSENVKLWVNADTNTFIYDLDSSEWESGYSYEYDITVGEYWGIWNNGDDYYVNTAAGIVAFAELVNSGSTDINCTLMGDIDLGGAEWTPIGNATNQYNGIFDGAGCLISNLSVTSSDVVGLLGYTGPSAVIANLALDGSVSGGVDCVSGVVGVNYGTIINCCNMVSVSGLSHNLFTGGVASLNYGTIINCYNTGSVGSVGNFSTVGGVVGCNQDTGIITNCYNTGSMGSSYGGVVGWDAGSTTNCYYLETSAVGDSVAESKSADEMKDAGFVTTLNDNAYTYNNDNSPSIAACAWAQSDTYPTLDFGVEPTHSLVVE